MRNIKSPIIHKVIAITALAILLLASTACINYNSRISVDANGVATANVKVVSVPGITEQFKESVTERAIDCKIIPINSGYEFEFAPKKFEDLQLVGGVMEPSFIKSPGIFFDTYQMRCISLGSAYEKDDQQYLEAVAGLCGILKMGATFNMSLTLPYVPTKHNASMTENEGKTLIWTVSDLQKRSDKLEYFSANKDSLNADEVKAFIDEDWIFAEFRIYHRANIAGLALICLLIISLVAGAIRKQSQRQIEQTTPPAL